MKLTDILQVLSFYKYNEMDINDIEISHIANDSRDVVFGSLFICIKGYIVDGHDFANEAIANGAVAIISEKNIECHVPVFVVRDSSRALAMVANKFYRYPTKNLSLIGVTGTNGKTTVTYLLEAILRELGKKTGVIGTIQLKINDETYPVQNTTPDALFLQKTFKQMKNEGVEVAIMEVSSHGLDIGRVFGCDFDVAIYTNLSQDHLDYHHTMEEYIRAKSMLFARLGNAYENNKKYAILNVDDTYSSLLERSTSQHILTYSSKQDAHIMASDIVLAASGTSFTLETPVGDTKIKSKMVGLFNVYNMLAASAAAITQNIPITVIKRALERVNGVAGRFEPIITPNTGLTTIVDFAHTPASLENVLQTIKRFAKGYIYVVVGCGGDRDITKRPLMANVALQYANHAIFTSDNPRTEDPEKIIRDMTSSLTDRHYEIIQDRKQAIYRAVDLAEDDDIILIAGKGHETYQIIDHTKHTFDDRVVAKNAMLEKE